MKHLDIFHDGINVFDVHEAMDLYSKALGLVWATPYRFEQLEVWTPETGRQSISLEFTYSIEGPRHLEIMCGPPGSFYDPRQRSGCHYGFWSDDVSADVRSLTALGWTVAIAGARPEDGYGQFVYLSRPDSLLMVEVVSRELAPTFERWWGGRPFA